MKHHQIVFENIEKRTEMYLRERTFAAVAAFVQGYDAACEGGVLGGFREWIIVNFSLSPNLTWTALIVELSKKGHVPTKDVDDNEREIQLLFSLFKEFDRVRSDLDGLRRIYVAFDQYMLRRGLDV